MNYAGEVASLSHTALDNTNYNVPFLTLQLGLSDVIEFVRLLACPEKFWVQMKLAKPLLTIAVL